MKRKTNSIRPAWAKDFVTKGYLDQKLDKFVTKDYLDERLDEMDEKLDKKLTKFRDDILTAVDGVMGELKDMREEQTLVSGKFSEHTDTLENHESRLQKLEKSNLASI